SQAPIGKVLPQNINAGTNGGTKLPIIYHNGPVMLGTINVYLVGIIRSFIRGIGGTTWFNIMKKHYQIDGTTKTFVTGPFIIPAEKDVGYTFEKKLNSTNIKDGLIELINNGDLDDDPNGIYLWLTSADVSETDRQGKSFIHDHCGWHSYFSIDNTNYVYGFIGNPGSSTRNGCTVFNTNPPLSPNNDPGVDSMITVIAHELAESLSDPNFNAWYDRKRDENADKW
ncbi:unnamed protein product, partial [Rotaria sp. Silwood1]